MNYNFKDKEKNVHQMNDYMLAKTLSMFEWENLPPTIPQKELEKMLQINGYAFITKHDGELYAFMGGLGGKLDAYGNPTEIIISNPHLNFNKTLSIVDDGVLIFNDDLAIGLMPLFEKYNFMLAENDINMTLHGYSTRMKTLISAPDDRTKESAESYVKKLVDGEISIIGDNAMFDGIKVQSAHSSQGSSAGQLTEYHQYIKAALCNEIGLNTSFSMKKERLITAEVEQGNDALFPYVYNMMQNRIKAVDLINEMFDVELNVDFGSVWNLKNRELVDGIIEPTKTVNEPSHEPSNEPSNEPLTDNETPLETPPQNDDKVDDDEQKTVVENSDDDSKDDTGQSQAKTIDELMELLNDENLTDADIQAIEVLIKEIEDKQDD